MTKVGKPKGLIRYTTENALEDRPTRILRPRILIYASALLLLITAWVTAVTLRRPLAVDVIRDRNALYRLLDDGRVENVYDLKIMNKTEQAHSFTVSVRGAGALEIDPQPAKYLVQGGDVFPAAIRVRRPAYEPVGSENIVFSVQAADDQALRTAAKARFIAPAR